MFTSVNMSARKISKHPPAKLVDAHALAQFLRLFLIRSSAYLGRQKCALNAIGGNAHRQNT